MEARNFDRIIARGGANRARATGVGAKVAICACATTGIRDMANADHLDLLVNKGVEAWNEWRGDEKVTLRRNPDGTFDAKDIVKLLYRDNPADPDLSGANLARAELVGANLSWTNLTRVNLRGADLHKAQLRNARLFEADLTGALLDEANLMFADLTTANLSKACLFRA